MESNGNKKLPLPPTTAEFAREMRRIKRVHNVDLEVRAGRAHKLMLSTLRACGYGEGCDVYENMEMW